MAETRDVRPGDWVRFQRDGNIVMGVVHYIRDVDSYPWAREAVTDAGTVRLLAILETRPPATPPTAAPPETP